MWTLNPWPRPQVTQSFSKICEKSGRAWEIKPHDINAWVGERFEQDFNIIINVHSGKMEHSFLQLA